MSTLTVRVVVHETSRPVDGLIVTWYVSRDRHISRRKRDALKWDRAVERDADTGHKRLGSALTNAYGQARLELRPALTAQGAPELFVWYALRTAEIAGESCSRTVHVGCDSIPFMDADEEFLVRLPRALLDSAAIDRRVSDTVDGVRDMSTIRDALRKAENLPAKRVRPAAPFSAKLSAAMATARAVSAQADADQLRAGSCAPGLERKGRDADAAEPRLQYDNAKRYLTVTDPRTQADQPVTYKGVVRYTSPGLTEQKLVKPHLQITESTGVVEIALPSVPDELVLESTQLSELIRFSQNHKRRMEA